MESLKEKVKLINVRFERYKKNGEIRAVFPALRQANEGALDDVLNTNGVAYYQWGACLADVLQPKQVVELGGAMGVWDIMMLSLLPQESQLYSISLSEFGLEYSYVVDTYKNFHPIVGNDLDIKQWDGVNLFQTDLWFFDALHTGEQLTKELALYTPFFKKGAILLFDDIHMDEIYPLWESLPYEKLDISDPCHYSGYGIAQV